MSIRKGAVITVKGKFFVINLVLNRAGGRHDYTTPYGTYVRMEEARKLCMSMNSVPACSQCGQRKDCAVGYK